MVGHRLIANARPTKVKGALISQNGYVEGFTYFGYWARDVLSEYTLSTMCKQMLRNIGCSLPQELGVFIARRTHGRFARPRKQSTFYFGFPKSAGRDWKQPSLQG